MDPYATLGVQPDAPLREIKRAWRQIAKRCHPDKAVAADLSEKEQARREVRFREAREAWALLDTEEKRAAFDAKREQARLDALAAAAQREQARRDAQRAWEELQARRAREGEARWAAWAAATAQAARAEEQARRVAAHQAELNAWVRRADRRERARQRIQSIEHAKRTTQRRQLLLSGQRALVHGVDRVRLTLAAMVLKDL